MWLSAQSLYILKPLGAQENEKYLRQLEREGQGATVYGKESELVAPNAGFCVKTKNKMTGAKVRGSVCPASSLLMVKMGSIIWHRHTQQGPFQVATS